MGHKARTASVPFLLFILFLFTGLAVSALELKQVTNPIIFGKNVILLCSTTELNVHGRFAWKLDSVLLTRENVSSFPNKYTPTLQKTSTGFNYSLNITDFNLSDLNKVYKCEIGFKDINISLSLNEDDFIMELKQVTNPIIFGKNVTLLCSTTELNLHERFAWKLDSVLLTRDNVSSFPNKYTPTLQKTSTGFNYSLNITDFNLSDLNKVYKCEISFKEINISIFLNEGGFISEPTIAKKEIITDNCIFRSISLVLKNVFPRPICEIFYAEENYTKDLNAVTSGDGFFFTTILEIQKLPCKYNCRGNITLTCLLGNITYFIINKEYLCIEEVEISIYYLIGIDVVLGILVGILIWRDVNRNERDE